MWEKTKILLVFQMPLLYIVEALPLCVFHSISALWANNQPSHRRTQWHNYSDICSFPLSNPQNHLNIVRNICLCKYIVAELSLEI